MSLKTDIPKHWKYSKIKDYCEVNKINRKPEEEFPNKEFDYVTVSCVDGETGKIEKTEKETGKSAPSRAKREIHEGDVIVSTTRPYLRAFAIVPKELDGAICSTAFAVLKPGKNISTKFLWYAVRSVDFVNQLKKKQRGASYPAVGIKDIKKSDIPVPPVSEQKAIVKRLDAIFENIGEIQQAQEKSKEIQNQLESIIASDVFRELDEEEVELDQVTRKITDGSHQTPDYVDDGIYFLRAGDVKRDEIDWDSLTNISEEEHQRLSSRWPEKGDVLYTKNGTIGIAKAVDWEIEASIYVSLALIRPTDELDTFYLEKFLNTDLALQQAKDRTKTVSVSNLHLEEIKQMKIPLPDLNKQKSIVEQIEMSHRKIRENHEHFEKVEEICEILPKAVLAEAFRGELVDFEAVGSSDR